MNQRFAKRFLSLLIAVTMCTALFFPIAVHADTKSFRLAEGSIVIGADGDGLYVSVGDKRTTLSSDTEIRIEGNDTVTKNTISVRDNVSASITVSGVRIESTGFLTAPIELCGAERVTLKLVGANTLLAPQYMAALQVNRYAKLRIIGDGSLSARGGMSAAGIGGGWKSQVAGAPGGDVSIGGSVRISAYGGDFGAGIGGGEGGSSGIIRIDDAATVYALGGKLAAGIGSSGSERSKNITVTNSATVEAAGGEGGAGIGSGKGGSASKITLSGMASLRVAGGLGAAGIGSGHGGSATMVQINDEAIVRARGGEGAAAIGAGKDASLSLGVSVNGFSSVFCIGGDGAAGIGGSGKSAGSLSFSGSALVESYGGKYGAGIGGGKGGLVQEISCSERVSVYAYGGLNAAGIGAGENGTFQKISCADSSGIIALGGKYGAGIGGGKTSVCGEIRLYGNTSVTAQGGNFGAGIGTGAKNAPDYAPSAGSIYIYGDAAVRAGGGNAAAGVGGGLYASGGKVVVSGTASLDAYDNLTVSVDSTTAETLADYSVVDAALAKVPSNLADYTEQSVALLQATIAQIVYDLPSTKQAQVDAYAAAVERSISILVRKAHTRTLVPTEQIFEHNAPIVIGYTGATSPKDRILVLKKGHLISDTAIDPEFNIAFGTPLFSTFCTAQDGSLSESGTVTFTLDETHFLYTLGFPSLPAGDYTAYFYPENSDTPAASANFGVADSTSDFADYSAVNSAIASMPRDPLLYTEESWTALQHALSQIDYELKKEDQAKVDGYAKAIRDAIAALELVSAANATPANGDASAVSASAKLLPATKQALTASTLTVKHTDSRAKEELLLLAQSSGAPEEAGWGLIPMQSSNVETAGADSIVSAINRVVVLEDIIISEQEVYNINEIAPSKVGAGAGCAMDGSFTISDTALINAQSASNTVTLEYGASIGTLPFAFVPSDTFTLPTAPSCPGYIFKHWSTDEEGLSPISGSFTVTSDLTFYANWEIVPVSIEKEFRFSSGTLGAPYSDQLQLSAASASFTVSLSAGNLPKGLALDPASGEISGIPTDLGSYDFTLLIVDANGTRTEQPYSITVYQPVEMSFTFHTSKNEHSGTTGEISFSYSYIDRGSGALKQSAPINLTELLRATPDALTPQSVDTVTLSVGAFVGEPVQLFFTNSSAQDGYRIDKVVISSPGGDGMKAFEKTYQINTWIGNIDDANFFESGAFVVFIVLLILLLILLGLFFLLRHRMKLGLPLFPAKKKQEKMPDENNSTQTKKPSPVPNAPHTAKPVPTAKRTVEKPKTTDDQSPKA